MYKTTVGIEIHAELNTVTKVFSAAKNNYGDAANSNASAIDLAYPGTMPLLNEEVIALATKAAIALNCRINKKMHFDRKNYFYPDLAKGYQITQARTPIGQDGYVEFEVNDVKKKVRIHDIHIEEDTAKSLHRTNASLLDFNRAGVPLIEIVSEADIESAEEAVAYVSKLREILLYAEVSDVKIEEGSMRCDANVSISKTDKLGTRTEIKNIGSISNVGLAIKSEAKRQASLLDKNIEIEEETRKYDEKTDETIFLRKKNPDDYRYFPEADIPHLELDDAYIKKIKETMSLSADDRREIYKKHQILDINIEKLIANKTMSDYLNRFLNSGVDILLASNLILGDLASYSNKLSKSILELGLSDEKFIELCNLFSESKINSKILKDIIEEIITNEKSIKEILKDKKLSLSDDDDEIDKYVNKVIQEEKESVADFLSGNERALKHLMGMMMKESKGKVRPDLLNKALVDKLNKLK